MVTGLPAVAAAQSSDTVGVIVDIFLLVFVGGAALLVGLMFGVAAIGVIRRRASQRRSLATLAARPAGPQDSRVAAGLAALRRADPDFDEQLLLEAAQTASLLIFAAMSKGEEALLRILAQKSFWATQFGRSVALSARDRRREDAAAVIDGVSVTRRQRFPVDYQASVPELSGVELGAGERVSVRIAFSQLHAVARPGAAQLASAESAASVRAMASAVAKGMRAQMSGSATEVSWIRAYGHYDMVFARQAGTRTDPSAALSSRTCPACGATYHSELASACSHCRSERPPPWGQWRLASATALRVP